MSNEIRVRFAPSPTGYLHVGGLRTALYNYLYAKKVGGKFILRIEDTDRTRYVEGAVENLIRSLKLVGLDFDEGPDVGGEFGPYFQSQRNDLYNLHIEELLEKDKAYRCFCSSEDLQKMREESLAKGLDTRYDGRCRHLAPEQVEAKIAAGEPYVIREKIPTEGEMFFHDATLCFQMWQSCASCHPIDGRPHPLNWDLLNDGIGNPKNTRSLLLSHETPPVMITGVRDKAETAVRAGIRYIQFAVRPEEDARVIDEYLRSLTPLPSPHMVKSRWTGKIKLSKDARKGKKTFKKAKCFQCHAGPYYTDKRKYDVGTANANEESKAFDTPSLIEVWRTAPYLNDGRAATMKDVLTTFNENGKHGKTSGLSEEEIQQLAEYVLSL